MPILSACYVKLLRRDMSSVKIFLGGKKNQCSSLFPRLLKIIFHGFCCLTVLSQWPPRLQKPNYYWRWIMSIKITLLLKTKKANKHAFIPLLHVLWGPRKMCTFLSFILLAAYAFLFLWDKIRGKLEYEYFLPV